ncbi:MAG: hypothetical protein MSA88_07220 [[Pasteurella] aerogenes]|nr:hypothetical protein [[Pasteurella] aerogenes]MCI7717680.1 hypothetical protein [[Pasteurella] aerogenes]
MKPSHRSCFSFALLCSKDNLDSNNHI